MKKILIISNDKQTSLINFQSSEAFRIDSHSKNIFSDDKVYVFSENARKEIKRNNIIFLKDDIKSISQKLNKMDVIILFQNSHYSSFVYKLADKLKTKIIVDLYNPLFFEKLSYNESFLRLSEVKNVVARIIFSGDFFFCANRRQFDYYLGVLSQLGKINDIKPSDTPLAIVPTILNKNFKSAFLSKNKDFVFFGGFYPWFDLHQTIKFVEKVIAENKNITFIGIENPKVKGIFRESANAIKKTFIKEINKQVFIKDWVSVKDIPKELSKYRFALNFAVNSLEDELSYRTRLLTLLQNNVPILTNGNDEISKAIIRKKAGVEYKTIGFQKLSFLLGKSSEYEKNCSSVLNHLSVIETNELIKVKNFINKSLRRKNKRNLFLSASVWIDRFKKTFTS